MVKKYINTSFVYFIAAIVFGVFFREFTKFMNFSGITRLSVMHTHTFILGMFLFLIAALMEKSFNISQSKSSKKFYIIYNIGLVITLATMFTKGVLDVLNFDFSTAFGAALAGISGLGHIVITIGFILFFVSIKNQIKITEKSN